MNAGMNCFQTLASVQIPHSDCTIPASTREPIRAHLGKQIHPTPVTAKHMKTNAARYVPDVNRAVGSTASQPIVAQQFQDFQAD